MNSKSSDKCAVLKDQSGNPVPLTGIDVRATIDDVLTRACITQTYENREEHNIEAVYTFPLLLDAVLLDFTVRIDGKVRRGTVMKKSTARADYENAVEQGDSAAMLENTGDGLYSMSVGNLLAGQKIEISFSYAYPNVWNGRLLRFMLPTVIAEKYGDPASAGIDDCLAPVTSVHAQNPYQCTVTVTGSLVSADISSPTHRLERSGTEGEIQLSVSDFADRDLVIELRSCSDPAPYACCGRDGENYVAAVAMTPDFGSEVKRRPREVDIIIDCSGSMTGDSIIQARTALLEILNQLQETDSFNIIRFGSTVEPLFSKHEPYSENSINKARELLEELDANLGGTELEDALSAAFRTGTKGRLHDLLLITDGQVYEGDDFYSRVQKAECRIFTVGVGDAVSEGLLKKLSQITGGMAEFVTPNENMSERIVRHFQRMNAPCSGAQISWPEAPDWIWPLGEPKLFHGDTAVFFAGFSHRPAGMVKLTAVSENHSFSWECILPEHADETEYSDLARICMQRRLSGKNGDNAAELAEKYRLVTPLTSYLLIEENAGREELPLPQIRVVPQMAVLGMGGAISQSRACGASAAGMFSFMSAFAGTGAKLSSSYDSCCAGDICPDDAPVEKDLPQLIFNLAALNLAASKSLFAAAGVDELCTLELPDGAAHKLRDIISIGICERTVFVLFMHMLLIEFSDELNSAVIGSFIKRSYSRLTAAEKNLSPEIEKLFEAAISDIQD